jgi:transposase InsO family protein
VFHSDRGSQYTSKHYRKLLANFGIRASMGDVGACWDIDNILSHTDSEGLTRAGIDQVSLC